MQDYDDMVVTLTDCYLAIIIVMCTKKHPQTHIYHKDEYLRVLTGTELCTKDLKRSAVGLFLMNIINSIQFICCSPKLQICLSASQSTTVYDSAQEP